MPINTKRKNLKIINAGEEEFQPMWKYFLEGKVQYGYNYQLQVIEYYKMLSAVVVDRSFVLANNDIPLAICVLFIETFSGKIQASWACGGYLPIPLLHDELSSKQVKSLEGLIFDNIEEILDEHNTPRMLMRADSLSVGFSNIEDQMLARLNALDISTHHHIMDLSISDDLLWKSIRHSYKSIINSGLKEYKFKVYDQKNYKPNIGERHRILHHKTSGKVTRPIDTFEKMYSWIEEGCGLMFEQSYKGRIVSMILVALGKNTAMGASAADDPEIEIPIPLTHSMNYFILQEIRQRGIRYYDIGPTPHRSTPFLIQTQKEIKINYFKRGFGDRSHPLKLWVWFSNAKEEAIYIKEQLQKYEKFNASNNK
jgi:hypothetical protein